MAAAAFEVFGGDAQWFRTAYCSAALSSSLSFMEQIFEWSFTGSW
jgi:hypothetical protein